MVWDLKGNSKFFDSLISLLPTHSTFMELVKGWALCCILGRAMNNLAELKVKQENRQTNKGRR